MFELNTTRSFKIVFISMGGGEGVGPAPREAALVDLKFSSLLTKLQSGLGESLFKHLKCITFM